MNINQYGCVNPKFDYIPHSSKCEHCPSNKYCGSNYNHDKSTMELIGGLNRKKKKSKSKVKVKCKR